MTEPESEAKGLDAAMADLEREVDAKVATLRRDAAEHVAKLETELACLRTDQEQMARNLKLSETQSRDLRAVAQTAGARIDHAIAGIKSVLADGG